MLNYSRRLLLASALVALGACAQTPPDQPDLLVQTATIQDIMDAIIDPSADFLFEAVAMVADERGVTERAPQTDDEWREVRRRAIQLLEAPNLLAMRGRQVARVDDAADRPEVELPPDEIQALIEADWTAYTDRARDLQTAAALAVRASDARDKDALFRANERIDRACENCHLRFWYPNDARAREAAGQN